MKAHLLNIEKKHRQHPAFLASLKDFSYSEGGTVEASSIVDNPQISLYCLDDDNRQAIFVKLPVEVDLTKAAFIYQTQYEEAQQLTVLSYQTFNQLANQLPDVQQPIFIYTTGRSGSTLLHHALNESQLVTSLSEPDICTQFVNLRHDSPGARENELCQLVKSTIRFLFRFHHRTGIQAQAVKLRSQGTQVLDLFQGAFPQAKNIFLYRAATAFVASYHRIFLKYDRPAFLSFADWQDEHEEEWGTNVSHLAQYLTEPPEAISLVTQLTLWWLAAMEWYLTQSERGYPVLAIDYADMINVQEEVLRQIFSYCGLSFNTISQALRVFNRDAQAGTPLARENPKEGNTHALTEAETALLGSILQKHPVLNHPDFIAPGTYQV